MDQHPSDAQANGNGDASAERIPAGHAWFVVREDQDNSAMLIACQPRDLLESILGHVEFNLRTRSITVVIDGSPVPVVVVMMRIAGSGKTALFSAWINQLSPRTSGILESLASQPQLLIALVDEAGRTVATSLARNVLSQPMESSRGWIANLAQASPWTRQQFAAARSHIQRQHPTNEDLWARFDEDSASESGELKGETVSA